MYRIIMVFIPAIGFMAFNCTARIQSYERRPQAGIAPIFLLKMLLKHMKEFEHHIHVLETCLLTSSCDLSSVL